MAPASIRARMTSGYVVVLMLTLLGSGVAVYVLLSRALVQRVDEMLDFELAEARERLAAGLPIEELSQEPAAFHETFLLRILAADGRVLAQSSRLDRHSVALPAKLPSGAGTYHWDARLGGSNSYRWVIGEARNGTERMFVQIATSREALEDELEKVRRVLLTMLPAGALAAAFGGYWMAGRALVPVQRMTEAAHRISADNLGDRITVACSHDELGQLATTLNAMLDRIDQAFAASRRFTADAAHELRTPIASIRAEAELCLRSRREIPEYEQILGSVLEEAERLTRLTDRLLLLSRNDAEARFPVRSLRLDLLVARLAEGLQPTARKAGLELRVEELPPVVVDGDDDLLSQAFDNLLDNAVKYTGAGGTITVRGGSDDGWACVEISDTGIGIPEELLPRVFDRFYRVDPSRSRHTGGTGLGLSIARSVIQRHGGTINVMSRRGSGSRFLVSLPTIAEQLG